MQAQTSTPPLSEHKSAAVSSSKTAARTSSTPVRSVTRSGGVTATTAPSTRPVPVANKATTLSTGEKRTAKGGGGGGGLGNTPAATTGKSRVSAPTSVKTSTRAKTKTTTTTAKKTKTRVITVRRKPKPKPPPSQLGDFAALPTELLLEVFGWLDASTLITLALVNDTILQLAYQDSLWRRLCRRDCPKARRIKDVAMSWREVYRLNCGMLFEIFLRVEKKQFLRQSEDIEITATFISRWDRALVITLPSDNLEELFDVRWGAERVHAPSQNGGRAASRLLLKPAAPVCRSFRVAYAGSDPGPGFEMSRLGLYSVVMRCAAYAPSSGTSVGEFCPKPVLSNEVHFALIPDMRSFVT